MRDTPALRLLKGFTKHHRSKSEFVKASKDEYKHFRVIWSFLDFDNVFGQRFFFFCENSKLLKFTLDFPHTEKMRFPSVSSDCLTGIVTDLVSEVLLF